MRALNLKNYTAQCHSINLITTSYYHRNDDTGGKASVVTVLLRQTIQSANSRRHFLTHVNANTLLKPEKDILANKSKMNNVTVIICKVICLFAVIKTLSHIVISALSSSLRNIFRCGKVTDVDLFFPFTLIIYHVFFMIC